MPRNILAIGFSSDRTSFNSARFLGSYIIDSIVKRVCVCVFLRRLFLGIRCFIKSSVACKYRLEIRGESWRSVETSSLNRVTVWTARELSASNIVDPSSSTCLLHCIISLWLTIESIRLPAVPASINRAGRVRQRFPSPSIKRCRYFPTYY